MNTIKIIERISQINLPASLFAVGGIIRDALLKRRANDIDLVVARDRIDETAGLLAQTFQAPPIALGEGDNRIIRFILPEIGQLDIAPMVGDSIEADLRRRDFTINAIALDLKTMELIDSCGGVEDICNRTIRVIAPERFDADPIRILRAFRFQAQLGFQIAPETLEAIVGREHSLNKVAAERIGSEWEKLLSSKTTPTIRLMGKTGVLGALIPEVEQTKGCSQDVHRHQLDVFEHTMAVLATTEALLNDGHKNEVPSEERWLLKFAALLHDIGKPLTKGVSIQNGSIHFHKHEEVGASMAERICRRMKIRNQDAQKIAEIIRLHLRPLHLFDEQVRGNLTERAKARFKLACGELTPHVLIHALADHSGATPLRFIAPEFERFIEELAQFTKASNGIRPLITGKDLITVLGLKPSPLFKSILASITEAQVAGEITDKAQALELAAQLI